MSSILPTLVFGLAVGLGALVLLRAGRSQRESVTAWAAEQGWTVLTMVAARWPVPDPLWKTTFVLTVRDEQGRTLRGTVAAKHGRVRVVDALVPVPPA